MYEPGRTTIYSPSKSLSRVTRLYLLRWHTKSYERLMIKCLTTILIELEFGNVGFRHRIRELNPGQTSGKRMLSPQRHPCPGISGEKPVGARTRTNNKPNPHMTPRPGIEPGPHWWEASALIIAPSLLPQGDSNFLN